MKKTLLLLLLPFSLSAQVDLDSVLVLVNQKSYVKAEYHLNRFLENNVASNKALELKADVLAYQKKWDEASEIYYSLVEENPKSANFHYKYGGVLALKALEVNKLRALLLLDDIKSSFLKAAQLDKKHIDVRWALIELYMHLPGIVGGSNEKALFYADELERISKVDGYLSKGYVYEYTEQPNQAEYYYKKAIVEGGSVVCYSKLYSFYENQGAGDKAIEVIQESQLRHHRNALHYQLGKVSAEFNLQLDKGERCLLTYIENYTEKDGVPLSWAYYRLAQIYQHKQNKSKAIAYINLAVDGDSQIALFQKKKEEIQEL
ncbi:MAG: hypothetical protein BM564_10220 [Bacteroidetes bacterium MedPE-SWsnd-G2]|nr:MAG: hypothetical protein BM564_10220 [Bacteroidetes bacterium MedPE-SWsnd-G2]